MHGNALDQRYPKSATSPTFHRFLCWGLRSNEGRHKRIQSLRKERSTNRCFQIRLKLVLNESLCDRSFPDALSPSPKKKS